MEKGSLLGNIAFKVKNIDKKTNHHGCTGSNEEGLATPPKDASNLGTDREDPLKVTGLGPNGNNPAAPKPMSSNSAQMASMSFANVLKPERAIMKTNFMSLFNSERVENFDLVLLKSMSGKVKNKYDYSLIGYFVGKSLAFPIVQNYFKTTWRKFGFQKLMRTDDGVFLFKFESQAGLEQAMKVLVWVKLYNVLLLAYSDDGLSLIATQIGKPIMLDAFTSLMCIESWGRISFARALIEISSETDFKNEVVMAIPNEEGNEYTKEVVRVKYKWKPPYCVDCKTFRHSGTQCPNRVKESNTSAPSMAAPKYPMEDQDDGFIEVKVRKNKGKKLDTKSRPIGGVRLTKHKPNFYHVKPVVDTEKTNLNDTSTSRTSPGTTTTSMSNSFDVLNELSEEGDFVATTSNLFGDCVDDYDDDEVHLPGDTRKKEEVKPTKSCIWSGRKYKSSKRNLVFSPVTQIHYFDKEYTKAVDSARVVKEVEHGNG
nr:hypothetical protein [Tanacetum cinerariifolium]